MATRFETRTSRANISPPAFPSPSGIKERAAKLLRIARNRTVLARLQPRSMASIDTECDDVTRAPAAVQIDPISQSAQHSLDRTPEQSFRFSINVLIGTRPVIGTCHRGKCRAGMRDVLGSLQVTADAANDNCRMAASIRLRVRPSETIAGGSRGGSGCIGSVRRSVSAPSLRELHLNLVPCDLHLTDNRVSITGVFMI
jgi:hypothetical protein